MDHLMLSWMFSFYLILCLCNAEIKSQNISKQWQKNFLSQSTLVELKAFLWIPFPFVSFFINSENNILWICCILSELQSNLFSAISSYGWLTELRDRENKKY